MSTAQQAKAARRKARRDPRYAKQARKDIAARERRLKQKVASEQARKMRKKKG